jgi:hypothetical protein
MNECMKCCNEAVILREWTMMVERKNGREIAMLKYLYSVMNVA